MLIYALVGLLCMFFLRKFPLVRYVANYIKFSLDCNLCLGFWVYLILAPLFGVNVLDWYRPVISEVITAASTAFVVHLAVIGWNSEYRILEIK